MKKGYFASTTSKARKISLNLAFFLSLLLASTTNIWAQAGIWDTYIFLGSGPTTYFVGGSNNNSATAFTSANLGSFAYGGTFNLAGGSMYTYKINNNGNMCGGNLNYNVYISGGSSGSYSAVTLSYNGSYGDQNNGSSTNQEWSNNSNSANLLSGLAPGTYNLILYYNATGNSAGSSGCGTNFYESNGGGNYIATFSVTPTVYTVAGGGAYCSGGSGVTITLSGSQSGVNYQLYRGASPVGSAMAGTGSGLTFPAQTTAGTYTVVATSTAGTVATTSNMSGSATVSVTALPTISSTAQPSVCTGTIGAINLTGLANSTSYTVIYNFNGSGNQTASFTSSGTGTGTFNTYRALTTTDNGSNLTITSLAGSCANTSLTNNTVSLAVSGSLTPTLSILASPSGAVCSPTSVLFSTSETNGGVSPTFNFMVNGNSVQNNTSTSYSYSPSNNDVVTCIMTSSSSCASPSTANSNSITETVALAPTVTAVAATTALGTQGASNSGYYGQQISISGSNFTASTTVSFNGTAAASISYQDSGLLYATVAVGTAATGNVVVTNSPCTAYTYGTTFNVLGYIATSAGDWTTPGTWLNGAAPTSTSTAVTINAAVGISTAVSYVPTSITINTGANITFGSSGTITVNTSVTNNGTLTMTSGGAINMAAGGTFTNNTTFTAGTGNVNFAGAGFINGNATTFNNITVNTGLLTLNAIPTIGGYLYINGTGCTFSQSPKYGGASTLNYNSGSTFARGLEWTANNTSVGAQGAPYNVLVSNGTTLNYPGSGLVALGMAGSLTINSGHFYMDYGSPSTTNMPLTVAGNVSINGDISLGYASGCDIIVGGNWTFTANSGNFNTNKRAVFFNGSNGVTPQVIQRTVAGTLGFDYIVIENTGAGVQLSGSPATSINLNAGNGGNGLSWNSSTANFDVNGNSAYLAVNQGISTSGADNIVNTNGSVGYVTINTGLSCSVGGSGTLTFGTGVTVSLYGGLNFGNNLSTVKGTLLINAGGYVTGYAPTYYAGSLLQYYSATTPYGRGVEWSSASGAGYPYDVQISNSTTLDATNSGGGGGSSTTTFNLAHNLLIDANSAVDMNWSGYNMTVPLIVGNSININGTLVGSNNAAGSIQLKGDWNNNGNFYWQASPVIFNGSSLQNINGNTTAFGNLTISNSANVNVGSATQVTVNASGSLNFTTGKLVLNNNTLVLLASATVSGAGSSSYVQTNGVGQMRQSVANSDVYFTVGNSAYNPIVLNNQNSTANVYGINVVDGSISQALDPTKTVNEKWYIEEIAANTSNNLKVTAVQWNSSQQGTNFSTAANKWVGFYNGSSWTKDAAGLNTISAGIYQFINASSFAPATITNSLQTEFFAIGDNDGFYCPTITAPTYSTTNVACYGGSTGAITITAAATGGTAPYQYTVNGGTTYQSYPAAITGLSANTYPLIATDSDGCSSSSVNVTISQPSSLPTEVAGTPVNASCYGTSTGSVTITPSGGTSNYVFSKDNGATFSSPAQAGAYTFTGLAAGSYQVVTKDANGCTTSPTSVSISQPALLVASAGTPTEVSCHGTATGSIIVTASGGTANFQYSDNGGTSYSAAQSSTTYNFTGLTAASYPVSIKDANACIATTSFIITEPAVLGSATVSYTNVSCNSGDAGSPAADGTVTVSTIPTGGTPPFTYSLNGGAYQSSTTFTGLTPGNYSVVTQDANGCISGSSNSVTITQPAIFTAPTVTTTHNVSCYGMTDGEIDVTTIPTGGTGPYTYTIVQYHPYQSSTSFTGLGIAGNYWITAMDANGCLSPESNHVGVVGPAPLEPGNIKASDVLCNGAGNGTVSYVPFDPPSGGTSPYQFSLNGGPYQSNSTFTGLLPGSYSVVVEDANGCISSPTGAVTVSQPSSLGTATISSTNALCNGANNGTVTVTTIPTGGTNPYSYSLNGGAYQSSTSFTGLGPNTYSVVTEDANGCISAASNTVTITEPAVLTAATITNGDVSCNGAGDGTVTISTIPTGGTSPYTYSLNGGAYQSGTSFTSLAPDNYTVVAKDSHGCTSTSNTVTISQPAVLGAATISETDVLCSGASNGTVTVSTIPTGGTPSYTYSLNGGAYQSGTTFSGLAPNSYSVVAKDANGCISGASNSVTITQPSSLGVATISSTNALCNGAANGTVTVSTIPSGGTPAYQYSLNGGAYQSSTSFTGLAPNSYSVVAKDANGCISAASNSVTITEPSALTAATITGANVTCNGAADGSITVSTISTGGTSPYTYSLNGGAYQSGTTFSGLTPSAYTVVAKDAHNCISSASNSVTITEPAALGAATIGSTDATCHGGSNGIVTVTTAPTGGTPSYQYSLNSGSYQSSLSFTGLTQGNYSVVAKDANGCVSGVSNTVTVGQPAATTASASNEGPYVVGQTITLLSSSTGAVSYQWSGPASYSANGQTATRSGVTAGMTGFYTVTATNSTGCTATASTFVVITTNAAYTWTGATSSDWTIPSNWSPVAPVGGPNACAIDVTIPHTYNNPVITSAIGVGNLSISGNAQLTLSGANISICGDWTGGSGAKALVTGSGMVVMNGSSAQTISGQTAMQELQINNTAGISMQSSSALDLYVSLDLQSGNFDATGGDLTFKSTTVNSVAIIDNFSAGYSGTLTGNINAERYYAASATYNQHFMGSPVNTPSMAQFGASGTPGYVIPYPYECDETRLARYSPYGSVFSYHESNGASCEEQQWYVETSGNTQNGHGYSILKDGAGTLVLNGTANLSNNYQLPGLTNSNWSNTSLQGHHYNSGWQLVANPYLATLNLTTTPTGFDNQVQVWNANGPYAGTYQPYSIGVDAEIPPFQAFMVHVSTGHNNETFVMNATDRVRTAQTFYLQNANELKILATNTANGLLDQTTVAFNPSATDSFDAQMDAQKFPGGLTRHTLYSVNNGLWMARNVLTSEATTSTVPVGFEPGATSTYSFSFNGINTFDPTSYIYLEDKALNVMHNARSGNYTFTADSADAWDRFVLHFSPPAQVSTVDANCSSAGTINIQQPGTANWNYILTNSNNAIITSGILNQSQPLTVAVAPGTYTLTLTDVNNYVAVKTITVNGPQMVSAGFQVSSDTVQTQQTITLSTPVQAGDTYQWNLGNGQQASGANATASYSQPGVYTLSLLVTNAAGCSATQSQNITVTANTTGLANINANDNLNIWSYANKVYVDFTNIANVEATVTIYNILGQEICSDHYTNNNIYQKEIDNIEAAYMIVMVRNDDKITTKKVLITNNYK